MYRQLGPDEYRRHLKLPNDYVVSGFLCHGTWRREEEIENLKEALSELKLVFKINKLPGFLERMVEFRIEGRIFWFDVPYGGARLSEYLQLACLFGSKKNILIGSCGGLSPNIEACSAIISTWSYGNESSTRMYSPENKANRHFPDKLLTQSLRQRFPKSITVFEGPTMTCEAMLGESWEDIQTWSKEGYLGVEMEASTVFAVSNYYKVPSAALLVVGDNLIKEETTLHENFEKLTNKRVEIRQEFMKAAILELLNN
jgi:purine-nucleoside phosphorylase